MTTIIKINNKDVEIELTPEQVKAITKANKNKFEIDYEKDGYYVNYYGDLYTSKCNHEDIKEFGAYRKTEELAQRASDAMRARNRLEELVHWLEPDWKPDWNDDNQGKYYVYYSYSFGLFDIGCKNTFRGIGTVYMSEQTARKIRNALNNGELEELKALLLKG